MDSIDSFIQEWNSDSPFIKAHTSGSTGKPKEIDLLKADMLASAKATNTRFGIVRHSTLALPLSVDYIAGKMMCVRAWLADCRLLQLPVSNSVIITEPIDLLAIVPSQIDSLLSQPDAPRLIHNLIIGGATIPHSKIEALVKKSFHAFSTYGMTETCSHVAISDLASDNGVYHAMPGISFTTDPRDCLVIIAPQFSFRRLVTNDIVNLIDPHSFRYIGRYDNVINSGGIKISAEQLESKIQPLVDKPFYITSIPDNKWGESIVIVIEGLDCDTDKIMDTLRANIDHRICPKSIKTVDKIKRTTSGKIIRK